MTLLTPAIGTAQREPVQRARGEGMAYRADVDGLRAVAIGLVLMFHAFPSVLPAGYIGVDIFFVISGFLITGILAGQLQRGAVDMPRFYANRALRLFPALLVVLASCFAFGRWVLLPEEFEQLSKHIVSSAAFLQNFGLWSERGYFDAAAETKPLLHLWSLAVEEQFYLGYPLLLWCAWRLKASLLPVVLLVAAVSFVWCVVKTPLDADTAFFLPHTRIWELMVGGALALAKPWLSTRTGRWRNPASLTGVSLLAVALLLINEKTRFPGAWALLPVVGAALLIAAGPGAFVNQRLLANKLMVGIGLISYPLYLWHWPLLVFARLLSFNDPSAGLRFGAVLLSLLLAWLTYACIERPVQRGRRSLLQAASLAAALALIGALGYASERGVVPPRATYADNDFVKQLLWTRHDHGSAECRQATGFASMGYCLRSSPRTPDAVLLGDSHGGGIYVGLAAEYERAGLSITFLGSPGCPPWLDFDFTVEGEPAPPCRSRVADAVRYALETPSVRRIYLSAYGVRNMQGDIWGAPKVKRKAVRFARQPELVDGAAFAAAFRATLVQLAASGKHIAVVIDWPELPFDATACFNGRPMSLGPPPSPDCSVERAKVAARAAEYRKLVEAMAREFPSVQWLDPWPHLCNATRCTGMPEGRVAYRDSHHLSKAGGVYLARAFRSELQLGERRGTQ